MQKTRILAVAASAFALSSGIALAGEVVWWTPNFDEPRARELVTKFEAENPGITVQARDHHLRRPAAAGADGAAVGRRRPTSSTSSTAG